MEEGTLDKSRSQVVTRQVMYQMHDTIQCGHGTHITGSRSCPSPTVGISAVHTEGTETSVIAHCSGSNPSPCPFPTVWLLAGCSP